MKDVTITCRKWDGHGFLHFSSSMRTDLIEGRDEFTNIRSFCKDKPLEGGYSYEYEEWEDGHPLLETIRTAYHPSRNDLF